MAPGSTPRFGMADTFNHRAATDCKPPVPAARVLGADIHLPRKLRPPPGTDRRIYVAFLELGHSKEEAVELTGLRALSIEQLRDLGRRAILGDTTIPELRRRLILDIMQP